MAYEATVALSESDAVEVTESERFHYVLPSRYCPSDRVEGFAATEFGQVGDETATVQRVVTWVHERLFYLPGSTTAADDALVPLGTGQGVCRDYAHLVVTMCRALGMPARYVSVYAPGLSPMDAHAVVEVAVDGVWRVFDATRLAPRASMVRIGTGRDAADTAILTALGGVEPARRVHRAGDLGPRPAGGGPRRARRAALSQRRIHHKAEKGPNRKNATIPTVLLSPCATTGAHSER